MILPPRKQSLQRGKKRKLLLLQMLLVVVDVLTFQEGHLPHAHQRHVSLLMLRPLRVSLPPIHPVQPRPEKLNPLLSRRHTVALRATCCSRRGRLRSLRVSRPLAITRRSSRSSSRLLQVGPLTHRPLPVVRTSAAASKRGDRFSRSNQKLVNPLLVLPVAV